MFKINLKPKQKAKFTLTLILITFVLVIFSAFSLIIYLSSLESIKSNFINEAKEIQNTYITVFENRLIFTPGSKLEEDLYRDRLSAMIYNQNFQAIGRYGLFKVERIFDLETLSKYAYESYSKKTIKIEEFDKGSKLSVSYPILKDNETFGVIQIIGDISQIKTLSQNIYWAAILLIPICAIISNLFINSAVNTAYKPINEIAEDLKNIDIHNMKLKNNNTIEDAEIKYIKDSFNAMLHRLSEGIKSQRNFLANASHELKTPITRVIGDIEREEVEKNIDLSYMKEDLINMSHTINSLLDLANIYEGQKLSKSTSVKQLIETLKKRYKDIHVKTHIESINIPHEYTDIILSNLISNSYKHNNGKKLKVSVLFEEKQIKITDNGSGINKSDLNKITQRYYSLATEDSHGLGLAIVKEIISKYNLKIKFQSPTSGGLEITITGFKSN